MLKGRFRQLTRSAAFRHALAWLIAWALRLIYATGRWQVIGLDHPAPRWQHGKPVIGCFWHARMLLIPYARRWYGRSHMLISAHRDGLLIAETIRRLGVHTIVGSTNRRPAAALRELLSALARGETVAITPDGPRGPRMRAAMGVIKLAQLSGAPIVPVATSARRRRLLRSWDRFMVVWPFNAGVVMFGPPIAVPRDADAATLEAKRLEVEAALTALTDEADRLCGHPPVAPADPPVRKAAAEQTGASA